MTHTANSSKQSPQQRKLFLVLKNEVKLTDEERIELAQYLLRRDITSYTQLDDDQVNRLLDAVEGYQLITHLLRLRLGPPCGQ